MAKIEVERVPPIPESEDSVELRMSDLMNYGILITRDGKRIDPQLVYTQRPKLDPPFTYVRPWPPSQE